MIAYFEKFGTVRRAQIVFVSAPNCPPPDTPCRPLPSPPLSQDMKTGFSKGFGFVTMSSPEEVENVLEANRHMINGLEVPTLTALPKAY